MHFSTIFAAAALASTAFAENHVVAVGTKTGELVFQPDSIKAAQGDTVTFRFWPKNHSIAQAAFAKPCEPLERGFWSGFVPTTNAQAAANQTFVYEVKNASAPIWFYCSQGQHCQAGMVGVINPPQSGERTLAAFKNSSKAATSNVSPSSTAGTGGKLAENSSSSTSGGPSSSASGPARSTGAASQLTGNVAFAGFAGLFTYFLL
ncbi:Cupredoxin [Cucurbitaria berberidis CBS 394.84]|uniref:Cupredoxin n=1 Tax=Cucurbitaria berberidis CBS 394.84 TaxID=1168544 RepID=A0A9P4GLZ8_9PLEO|nr:Cupredoxin [Cucurbitaria berberidis CBS 394.84]KAF1847495.1 Cupredoxin [Cucurbitaria berberidis CBS 394.84]